MRAGQLRPQRQHDALTFRYLYRDTFRDFFNSF
jgi:hypothetical protein